MTGQAILHPGLNNNDEGPPNLTLACPTATREDEYPGTVHPNLSAYISCCLFRHDAKRTKTHVSPITSSPHRHYRLVYGIVGRALHEFECTKQIVTAVFDALQAHAHALEVAQSLHRDISAWNVVLTDEGRGILIDWDVAGDEGEGKSARHHRMDTGQFMSANLLHNPGKIRALTDDLESFLHVLAWMALCYAPPSDIRDTLRRIDREVFTQRVWLKGFSRLGGGLKRLALSRGHYPFQFSTPRIDTPLQQLLKDLSAPFQSLYKEPERPRTDEGQVGENVPLDRSDGDRYDEDMRCLRSFDWFIDKIRSALDRDDWPTDDRADGK